MKQLNFIAILFLNLLLLNSCKNSSDEKPSIYGLITNRSEKIWINYSRLDNGIEHLNPCDKDNEWLFSTTGNIDVNTGAVRCFIAEKSEKSKYSFLLAGSNNDQFYFRYSDFGIYFTVKCTILELSEKTFRFRFTYVSPEGTELNTVEYAFKTAEF